MAKNKITIDIEVNGKMQKATVEAGKLQKQLDGVSKGQDKVSKSARTADRNLKGAAQASSNSTKNFSKMAQGITGGLVPAYATLAANLFAVSAAFQFLKNASQTERLKQAQVEYATATGNALGYLSTRLQEASQGMLSFSEASAASAIGAAKGFSSKQMEDLAVSAGKVSKVLGRDFTDAFDRLVRGVSKAEPELLDELGVTLRLEKAKKRYADSLDIAVDAMSDYQISQSVLLETQRQIQKQFGDIENTPDPFVRMSKTFDDLIQSITTGVLPVFERMAIAISNNIELAVGAFAGFSLMILKSIIPMDSLKQSMEDWGTSAENNFRKAQRAQKTYETKLLRSKMTSAEFKVEGYGVAQGLAQQSPLAGKKGEAKFMKQLRLEANLTKTEMARMSQAVAGALRNIDKQGIVTSGAFKGMTKQMVLEMADANLKIRNQWAITDSKLKATWKTWEYRAKIGAAAIKMQYTSAAIAIGNAFQVMGGLVGKALKLISAIFTGTLLVEMIGDVKTKFTDLVGWFYEKSKLLFGHTGKFEDTEGFKQMQNLIEEDRRAKELEEFSKKVETNVESIEKHFFAAARGSQSFQKTLNSISQIDVKSIFSEIEQLQTDGLTDKANELSDRIIRALKVQVPDSILKEGEQSILRFTDLVKSVKFQQDSLKNAMTAVSTASSSGNLENMADAQARANEELFKLHKLTMELDKIFIKTGKHNLVEGSIEGFKELANSVNSLFGGDDLVKKVKDFTNKSTAILKKSADIEIRTKGLDTAGLSKLEKEEKLEQLKLEKQILAVDKARNDLMKHNEEMQYRASKEKDAAKRKADQLKQIELANALEVALAEGVRLKLNKQINDEVRKHQDMLNNMAGQNKVLDVEKQILDLKEKQLDVVKAQMDLEASRAQRQFDKDIRASRGFFNVVSPQKEAQMKIDLEKKLQAFKLNAAQKEFDLKQKQIQSEYKMLRLRNQIAITEAQKTLASEGLSPEQESQQKALIALYGQVGAELAGAEASALDAQRLRMVATKEEAASVIQALEAQKTDLSVWREIGTTFRSSFTSELSNFFTTWDWGSGSSSFKEAAKAFGRGIAQTVNQKANDILAEQITDMLFGGTSAASQMATAFEVGGTSAATKIAAAMNGGAAVGVSTAGFGKFNSVDAAGGKGQEQGFFMKLWEGFTSFFKTIFQAISGFITSIFAPSAAAASADVAATTANAAAKNLNTSATVVEATAKKTNAASTVLDTTATGTHTGEVIADTIATKTSAMTKTTGGGFFSFLGFKTGGIVSPEGKKIPGYASGGVARGSKSGHPAVLHGNEAVVPLPNGKSIPVDLQQGNTNNQTNNVAVNISMDNNGNAQQKTSTQDQSNLGGLVAAAVQRELANQKRPGGILSPYGGR